MSQPTIEQLQTHFGERVKTGDAVREQFGRDESFHRSYPPDAVVAVTSTEEVQAVVRICAANKTPIIPWGQGTSLEGQVAALQGGITIDLSQMNQVLAVNAADLDAVVQPGVTRQQLDEYLHDTGLFFPIDPGAEATLGGMAATRASGTNAVRYGTMREVVLNATVVLADGRVIKTANRARKSSAGYDLTRLIVGSEGTLGIITELTVRLSGIPEAVLNAICPFAGVASAVNTVIETIQMGVPIARIEFLDALTVQAINDYSNTDLPVSPLLLMEFHGSEAGVAEQAGVVEEIAQSHGCLSFQLATDPQARKALWDARHDAAYAIKAMRVGGEIWATDACVPISRLAECIDATVSDLEASELIAPIAGHVGDGNFHLCLVVNHDDPGEIARAEALHERMILRAIEMDGTCTGEHGVGYGKRQFIRHELGEAVDVMASIKQALDPDNILNPGKII